MFHVVKYSLAVKSFFKHTRPHRFIIWLPSRSSFWVIKNSPLGYQRGYNLRKETNKQKTKKMMKK